MFLKGSYSFFLFFGLNDARGNENVTHHMFSFLHEMVWSKVMSREKAIIIEHERRKDTEACHNHCCLNTALCFYNETKEPVYKSVRE